MSRLGWKGLGKSSKGKEPLELREFGRNHGDTHTMVREGKTRGGKPAHRSTHLSEVGTFEPGPKA
jgi:hypothetical protein